MVFAMDLNFPGCNEEGGSGKRMKPKPGYDGPGGFLVLCADSQESKNGGGEAETELADINKKHAVETVFRPSSQDQ